MEVRKSKDALGTRIKKNYENRTRYYLPRRTYIILRLDGCHFKTYTHGLNKPFDKALSEDIDTAIIAMLPQIQGAVFAYTQSDEISVLLTDFSRSTTSAWFDGNLQKICSVSASIMTAEFNRCRTTAYKRIEIDCSIAGISSFVKPAYFDSRVFTIPDRIEVMNYFIWRNQDCARNSVMMVAQSLYSHKELYCKSTKDMHEMIHQAGKNWSADYTDGEKNGRLIVKEKQVSDSTTKRNFWKSKSAWKFTEDKDKLLAMIPTY